MDCWRQQKLRIPRRVYKNASSQDEFLKMLNHAGFNNTNYQNMTGGIVALHTGEKINDCIIPFLRSPTYFFSIVLMN